MSAVISSAPPADAAALAGTASPSATASADGGAAFGSLLNAEAARLRPSGSATTSSTPAVPSDASASSPAPTVDGASASVALSLLLGEDLSRLATASMAAQASATSAAPAAEPGEAEGGLQAAAMAAALASTLMLSVAPTPVAPATGDEAGGSSQAVGSVSPVVAAPQGLPGVVPHMGSQAQAASGAATAVPSAAAPSQPVSPEIVATGQPAFSDDAVISSGATVAQAETVDAAAFPGTTPAPSTSSAQQAPEADGEILVTVPVPPSAENEGSGATSAFATPAAAAAASAPAGTHATKPEPQARDAQTASPADDSSGTSPASQPSQAAVASTSGTSGGSSQQGQTQQGQAKPEAHAAGSKGPESPVQPAPVDALAGSGSVASSREVPLETPETRLRGREELLSQLATHLDSMAATRNSRLRVQLRPASLGSVDLNLALRDGVLTLNISAELPQTRQMIEAALPQLRHALNERGMDAANVSLTQSGSSGSADYMAAGNWSGDQGRGGWHQAAAGRTVHAAPSTSGEAEQKPIRPALAGNHLVDYTV